MFGSLSRFVFYGLSQDRSGRGRTGIGIVIMVVVSDLTSGYLTIAYFDGFDLDLDRFFWTY